MNIILYNFEDATSEELVDFSNQLHASLQFALSLQEAESALNKSTFDLAVMYIEEKSEMIKIKSSILKHPETSFYITFNRPEELFRNNPHNFYKTNPYTKLLQIADLIKK